EYLYQALFRALGGLLQEHPEDPQRKLLTLLPLALQRRRLYEQARRLFDLAGDEVNYPPHRFAPLFYRAWREGLGITTHAGEAGGAENVRDAIRLLHASRIGHGVRAVENSDVVRFVQERGVVLEVCPTSNLQTGVVRTLGQHPLPDLIALGLKVTINTDDPSVSDTTLTDEYLVATAAIGLSLEQIREAILTAADAAFLPEEERQQLREQFQEWFAEE
ncbi:MAG TPA: adenosine deaminase family protein, partial [Anaerolineae bacterium]|nr:adenosine deaminase family protein [Anaerolineae bacterium]